VVVVEVVVDSSSLPQAPRARAAAIAAIAEIRLIAAMIAESAADGGNFARKLGYSAAWPASAPAHSLRHDPVVNRPSDDVLHC
jgi:hypothetical protein